MVFYRLRIRSKTANAAEVNEEKVEGGVKSSPIWGHIWSPPQKEKYPFSYSGRRDDCDDCNSVVLTMIQEKLSFLFSFWFWGERDTGSKAFITLPLSVSRVPGVVWGGHRNSSHEVHLVKTVSVLAVEELRNY
ncbi:hypothetical protein E2C01_051346 [Portunus trituberculatus]|uniref:Uncharacterized protein n=1 Tax=Portunus trituberculatus TaxID=210409 RepID=A0A5B7GJB2_PORTR|nr:hypothetical protein [Portunus trituberculatus]